VTPVGKGRARSLRPQVDPTAEIKFIDDMEVRGARAGGRLSLALSLTRSLSQTLTQILALAHSLRFLLLADSWHSRVPCQQQRVLLVS
jgi:hypothetical protein